MSEVEPSSSTSTPGPTTSNGHKDPEWVTLVSQDGYHFILDYRCAVLSGTIRSMLAGASLSVGGVEKEDDENGNPTSRDPSFSNTPTGGFAESKTRTANLTQIRGIVLEKVVEYLCWKQKFSDSKNDADIPHFQNRIPPEIALELLMAADFLDV